MGEFNNCWKNLRWTTHIFESVHNKASDEFTIRGTAITETTSRNGITYVAEELEKSAPTFNHKPILIDHDTSVKSIVGRIVMASYNPNKRSIDFVGRIQDKAIQEMISDGRIRDVSIGATVEKMQKVGSKVIARGIEGLELSFVAVPGLVEQGIAQSFENSMILREALGDFDDDLTDYKNSDSGNDDMAGEDVEDKSLKIRPLPGKTSITRKHYNSDRFKRLNPAC